MYDSLIRYDLGKGAEAFSTRRDCTLPYPVIQGHQIHGKRVAIIDRPGMTREDLEGFDAFVTNLPDVAIGARTADCASALIYDPVQRVVAAVHAGWKGTVLHVSQEAIAVMMQSFRCNPSDMKAAIGPAIGPDSFQVGEEVVEQFRVAGFPMEDIWSFRGDGDGTPVSGGHHIDLFRANRWLLEQAGIPRENIQVCQLDTYTDPSLFSARREGMKCGRIINAIKLLPLTEDR